MNTDNLQFDSDLGVPRIVSSPLGGGLFTNQYNQFQEWKHLSPLSKKNFNKLLDSCCKMQSRTELDSLQIWKKYRTIVDILIGFSFKYQVSVESIALRWLLQLNEGDNISIGTGMGMDLREEQGGKSYSRQRDLRQVFTFFLEEQDMDQLCQVSDLMTTDHRSGMAVDNEIDFTNRRLWM